MPGVKVATTHPTAVTSSGRWHRPGMLLFLQLPQMLQRNGCREQMGPNPHGFSFSCCYGEMLWKKQLEGKRVGFRPQSRGTAHRAWEVKVEELTGSWPSQPVRNQGDEGRLASVQLHFLLHLRNDYTLFVCVVCLCTHVGGRRQFVGVSSLLPVCGFPESGHQA